MERVGKMGRSVYSPIMALKRDNVFVAACIVLLGIASAMSLLSALQAFSIGKLLWAFVFIVPLLAILILIKYATVNGIPTSLFGSTLSGQPFWVSASALMGLLLAPAVICIGLNVDLTTFLIAGIILISFAVSVWLCIEGKISHALAILLAIFPFVKFIEFNYQGTLVERIDLGIITITPGIVWLLTLLCLTFFASKKNLVPLKTQRYPLIIICLFVVFTLISSLFSYNPVRSLNGTYLQIIIPYVFFLIAFKAIKNVNDIYVLVAAMIGHFLILSMMGMYFFYKAYGFLIGDNYFYGQGFFYFNIYQMATSSLIAALLLLIFWSDKFSKYRVPVIIALVFFSSIIFLSQTRVVMVSFGVALLGIIINVVVNKKERGRALIFIIGAICVIAALYFFSGFNFQRIAEKFGDSTFFVDNNRLTAWEGAVKMIEDYPIFGIGWGMWDKYVAAYIPPTVNYYLQYQPGHILNPHNFYLTIAVFWGVPALFLFFLIIMHILKSGLLTARKYRGNEYGRIIFYVLCAVICFIIGDFFCGEEHFFTGDNLESGIFLDFSKGFIFFLLAAIILKANSLTVGLENEQKDESV
jgi:O-antigen ligase